MFEMSRRELKRSGFSLLRILIVASISSSILNVTVLTVCLCTGRWVFGDVMCQGFAFISHLMVGGAAWLIALAGLERYYKLFVQTEHPCLFSEINTKLLVVGIYFLVAAVLSNPLYGWGEFSKYRGYFHFTILLSSSSQVSTVITDNENETFVDSNNFTERFVDNDTFLDRFNQCQPITDSPVQLSSDMNFTDFVSVITTGLKMSWNFEARTPQYGQNNMTYMLRSDSKEKLNDFLESHRLGDLGRRLVSHMFTSCDCSLYLCAGFQVDQTEVKRYQDIYMAFQDPMVCSLDFTSANQYSGYFVIVFVVTMSVFPCCSIIVLAVVTFIRWGIGEVDVPSEEWIKSKNLFVGGIISVLFCIPYLVFNILNVKGLSIPLHWHATILVLLYTSCLIPSMTSVHFKCLTFQNDPSPTPARKPVYLNNVDFELLQASQEPFSESDHSDRIS